MIDFEILANTIRVDCSDLHFGPFSVLIVPWETYNGITTLYHYYLTHSNYGIVEFMWGDSVDTLEEAAERAHRNAPDYIPDFIKKCFDEE